MLKHVCSFYLDLNDVKWDKKSSKTDTWFTTTSMLNSDTRNMASIGHLKWLWVHSGLSNEIRNLTLPSMKHLREITEC